MRAQTVTQKSAKTEINSFLSFLHVFWAFCKIYKSILFWIFLLKEHYNHQFFAWRSTRPTFDHHCIYYYCACPKQLLFNLIFHVVWLRRRCFFSFHEIFIWLILIVCCLAVCIAFFTFLWWFPICLFCKCSFLQYVLQVVWGSKWVSIEMLWSFTGLCYVLSLILITD